MIMISRTELARNTRKVIEQARKGQPVVVESYGEEQVAILDATDYRLLRAAAGHEVPLSAPIRDEAAMPGGLSEAKLAEYVQASGNGTQARWDKVMGAYLDGDISLGRAATLLELSRFELQIRCNRLGIPVYVGARTIEEAQREYEVLKSQR